MKIALINFTAAIHLGSLAVSVSGLPLTTGQIEGKYICHTLMHNYHMPIVTLSDGDSMLSLKVI